MGHNKTSSFSEILSIELSRFPNVSYEAKLEIDSALDNASIQLVLALLNLYNYFNSHIFSLVLPSVILRISDNQRRLAYYKPQAWISENKILLPEMSISKEALLLAPIEICQLIVRQMINHLQHSFGKPGLDNYSNLQFFQLMRAVGLGCATKNRDRVTGRQVIDYIIPDGLFERKFSQMPEKLKLPFLPNENIESLLTKPGGNTNPKSESDRNKVKYSCPVCKLNVWGKPELDLMCKNCEQDLTAIIPFKK